METYAGVDEAALPPDVELRGPIVGFAGQINDRTDLRLLEAIADRGVSLLLAGPKNPLSSRCGSTPPGDGTTFAGSARSLSKLYLGTSD